MSFNASIWRPWWTRKARSQKRVNDGPYKYVRHPQYVGFIASIVGFLIQWPTIITIVMAPVLIVRYILLAKKEEAYMIKSYPKEYGAYMQKVPAWFPKFS